MTEEPYWAKRFREDAQRLETEKREQRDAEERLRNEAKVNPTIREKAKKDLEELTRYYITNPPRSVQENLNRWQQQWKLQWLADPVGQQKWVDTVMAIHDLSGVQMATRGKWNPKRMSNFEKSAILEKGFYCSINGKSEATPERPLLVSSKRGNKFEHDN